MDVLIVAREDDSVALRLRQALEKRGRRVSHHDGPTAARLFTIRVASGATSVVPSLPMFVRASAWWHKPQSESADERFLRAEAYATFWSAAALSKVPVINRPGPDGSVGRMTAGGLASILSAPPTARRSETHVSCPELLGATAEELWGEDQDFRVAPVAQFRRGTPLRARAVNPGALYEVVTVVGKRGLCATSDPRSVELRLPARSVALVERAGVHFATVTWVVEDGDAAPVRLNATPEEFELRYHWSDVADALCEDLTP
jgi:hypothetical protein